MLRNKVLRNIQRKLIRNIEQGWSKQRLVAEVRFMDCWVVGID